MAYASDPAPIPGETPQPVGPDITPAPAEAPFPEITPNPSPIEAPTTPAFPDNGRPYDAGRRLHPATEPHQAI